MKSDCTWSGTGFAFAASVRQHRVGMDAGLPSGGQDLAPSPKELVLAAICGCTGMDVVGLLKKSKTALTSLQISAEAEGTAAHPRIFQEVQITFTAATATPAPAGSPTRTALIDAVEKSQTLFCGVSAMIAAACPIHYTAFLNGEKIAAGTANFAPSPVATSP